MRPQTELRTRADQVILKTLKKGVPFSTTDLTFILDGVCSRSTIYARVDVLEAKGYIKYLGHGKKTRSALWALTGKAKGKIR